MAIGTTIQYASVDELYLDPLNPRLGRHRTDPNTPQEQLQEWMRGWTLEELGNSYVENGVFWAHEALIAIREENGAEPRFIVVEGNRRLAALRFLKEATLGRPVSPAWRTMVEGVTLSPELFSMVPYVLADSRRDVQAFLGFRHVTGIKQWKADEKAAFITKLVDEEELSYNQVAKKIGSKAPTVRKNYVAYRMLLQMEEEWEEFDATRADDRFALLYMSIETVGAQKYLNFDLKSDPATAQKPVPHDHLENLKRFATWLFGTKDTPHLITDTRNVPEFGYILENDEAVHYLETTKYPKLDVAYRIAGGDEAEVARYLEEAANAVELALTQAHFFQNSETVKKAVRRVGMDVLQLLSIFPSIKKEIEINKESK